MRRLAAPLALSVLLVLAGCLGGAPAPPTASPTATDPLSLSIDNGATGNVTVRLRLLDGPVEGLNVTYANGTARAYDATSRDELPTGALDGAADVAPRPAPSATRAYTLSGTGLDGTTVDVGHVESAVYSATRTRDGERTLLGWGVVDCDGDPVTELSLSVRDDGAEPTTATCG